MFAGGRYSRHSSQETLPPRREEGREKVQPPHTPEDKTAAAREDGASFGTYLTIRSYYGLGEMRLPVSFAIFSAPNTAIISIGLCYSFIA